MLLQRRRLAFQTQMRIFKFSLSANERVERKEDVDPSHLDPLADAEPAGAPGNAPKHLPVPMSFDDALAATWSPGKAGEPNAVRLLSMCARVRASRSSHWFLIR